MSLVLYPVAVSTCYCTYLDTMSTIFSSVKSDVNFRCAFDKTEGPSLWRALKDPVCEWLFWACDDVRILHRMSASLHRNALTLKLMYAHDGGIRLDAHHRVRSATEEQGGVKGAAALKEAEDRLEVATQRHMEANKRESAAVKHEDVLRAAEADLSLREKAVRLAEAGTVDREQKATVLEDRPQSKPYRVEGGQPTSHSGVHPTVGRSIGKDHSEGSAQATEVRSLLSEPPIPRPGPLRNAWDMAPPKNMEDGRGIEGERSHDSRRVSDIEVREQQLNEWSSALAEQAGAMEEQASRLESAYDQLRKREQSGSAQTSGNEGARITGKWGEGMVEDIISNVEGDARSVTSDEVPRGPELSLPATAPGAEASTAALFTINTEPSTATSGANNAQSTNDVAQQADVDGGGRRLEKEALRLAEKERELEAQRRRLVLDADAATRAQARAKAERKEAADARHDATTLRLELEKERTKLDAEKGGLEAEKSLLAAERGRLATESARIRREDGLARGSVNATVGGAGGVQDVDRDTLLPLAATAAGDPDADGDATENPSKLEDMPALDSGLVSHAREGGGEGEATQTSGSDVADEAPAQLPKDAPPATPTAPSAAIPVTRPILSNPAGPQDRGRHGADSEGVEIEAVSGQASEMHVVAGVSTPASLVRQRDKSEHTVFTKPYSRHSPSDMEDETAHDEPPRDDEAGSHGGGVGGPAGAHVGAASTLAVEGNTAPQSTHILNSSQASSPRAFESQGRREKAVPHVQRHGRKSVRQTGYRPSEVDEDARVGHPTVESIRRRLHAGAGRGRRREADMDSSEEPSTVARTVRRRQSAKSKCPSLGPSRSSPFASSRLVVVGTPAYQDPDDCESSLRASPRSSRVPTLDPQLHEDGTPAISRPALSRTAAAAAAAAIAAREDPFLAQLHARLAGADHTLRQSLGRRQALLNRFGLGGSSVGRTSEGETSDFPSASADASPQATASAASSPEDVIAARRRSGLATARTPAGGDGDVRTALGSSPDRDARRRFGFTGAAETPRRGATRKQGERRQSPSPIVVPPGSATSTSGALASRDATEFDEGLRAQGQVVVDEDERDWLRSVARDQTNSRSASERRRGVGPRSSARGAATTAASDTDDTEAEKENLRDLMRALGAAEGKRDGAVEGGNDYGHEEIENYAGHADETAGSTSTPRRNSVPENYDAPVESNVSTSGVGESKREREEAYGGDGSGNGAGMTATGEADAGGGNTLMSSLRARNEDISSRLQDISLQVSSVRIL